MSNRHNPMVGLSNVDIPFPLQGGMEFFEDFTEFAANDFALAAAVTGKWIVGGTNGVIASITVPTLTTADGGDNVHGAINLVTTGASADDTFMQLRGGAFYLVAGRPMTFQARFRPDTITTTTQTFGMYVPNTVSTGTTNPLDTATNGIGFNIVNGAITYQVKNASTTVTAQATTGTVAASTVAGWVTLSFIWDGVTTLSFFKDGNRIATYTGAAIPTGLYLTPTFGITTTSAATKDMKVDYVGCNVQGKIGGR